MVKIAPVSGDLIVKGVLLIGAAALAVWAVRKAAGAASNAAGQAWDAAKEGAWAVTPWNNENIAYQTVNNTLFPDGSDTLGTWVYGVKESVGQWWDGLFIPQPVTAPSGWDVTPQGPDGPRFNNPSAYVPIDRGALSINPDALNLMPQALRDGYTGRW